MPDTSKTLSHICDSSEGCRVFLCASSFARCRDASASLPGPLASQRDAEMQGRVDNLTTGCKGECHPPRPHIACSR